MVSQYQPYQQRVIEEAAELNDKIKKLSAFVAKFESPENIVDGGNQALLHLQLHHMVRYHNVLETRISKFGVENAQ